MNTKYVLMAIVTCVFISEASPADAGLQCAIVGYHCTVIDYPGSTGSNTNEATGINDAGTIVGTWGNDGQVQGYMYDHGYFSALPQPPGYDFAHPNSINNRGDIVASVEPRRYRPSTPMSISTVLLIHCLGQVRSLASETYCMAPLMT